MVQSCGEYICVSVVQSCGEYVYIYIYVYPWYSHVVNFINFALGTTEGSPLRQLLMYNIFFVKLSHEVKD